MNGIEVVLNKLFYEPGDVIYGAVLYRVIKPSYIKSITVQLRRNSICSLHGRTRTLLLDQQPVKIFSFQETLNIGFYSFPFEIRLPTTINNSAYFSTLPGSDELLSFKIHWEVFVRARCDLGVIFIAKTKFYTFLSIFPSVSKVNESHTFKLKNYAFELFMKSQSSDTVSHVDITLVKEKGLNRSRNLIPGVSLKLSLNDQYYQLGGAVEVTVTSSLSNNLHIDSISYRVSELATESLLRHVEMKSELLGISGDGSQDSVSMSDVLFGVLRPSLTMETDSDKVELLLPQVSSTNCIWTSEGSLYSCRYEVEVVISTSLSVGAESVECTPIHLRLPLTVVPSKQQMEYPSPNLPSWANLCLVALAENEADVDDGHCYGGFLSPSSINPCQTVRIPGGKRGQAGVSPADVQRNFEFRKLQVFRHLGATRF